jgi:hypothetical protein
MQKKTRNPSYSSTDLEGMNKDSWLQGTNEAERLG